MALTFPKRGYAGAALAGTLKTPGLSAGDGAGVTFQSSTSLASWIDVTGGTFAGANLVVTFGYGTSSEEKILCTFNQATATFTIVTRGYDGTTAAAWTTGSLFTLTWTATEAAELNATTQSLKTILTNSGTTTTPQPITVGSGTGAIGSGTQPAAIDHDHKISASTLNGWLAGSAAGPLSNSVSVGLNLLATGALPTGITTSKVWTASSTSSTGPTISGITGYNNYVIIASSKVLAGSTGNLQLSISANGTSGINAVAQALVNGYGCTVATFAALSSTTTPAVLPSTTFSAQCVPSTAGTVSVWSNTLIVIGLN